MTKPRLAKAPVAEAAPRHHPADADADAFAKEMEGVARLAPDLRGRAGVTRRPASLPPVHTSAAAPAKPENEQAETTAGYVASGVDRRELRRLKRGDYPAGEQLDLHGLTAAAACARVDRFLDSCRTRGHRSVGIVHGRGLHSAAGVAVLKTRVRDYLRSHRSVLAYSDAPRSDGGAGAVYVLLRK